MTDPNFSDIIPGPDGEDVHGRCGGKEGECRCADSEFNRSESGYLDDEEDFDSDYEDNEDDFDEDDDYNWEDPRSDGYYGPDITCLGFGFDYKSWDFAAQRASDHLRSNIWQIPCVLRVWELIQWRSLPLWMLIAVPVLRLLCNLGIVGRRPRVKYPKVLTIGQYDLGNGSDQDEIPF